MIALAIGLKDSWRIQLQDDSWLLLDNYRIMALLFEAVVLLDLRVCEHLTWKFTKAVGEETVLNKSSNCSKSVTS